MAFTDLDTEATYAGDNATDTFAIPFVYQDSGQVKVGLIVAGVETLQTQGSAYTIVGGNIDMVTAPATGESLRVYRETALTQTLDLADNASFRTESLERQFDRLVMMIQEQASEISKLKTRVTALE